jgi:hypothetical protein
LTAQWEVVEAFLAAVRGGDFDALVAVLDPDVVLRGDAGGLTDLSRRVQGAKAVAGQALYWSQIGLTIRRALVNGAPGIVSIRDRKPFSVGAFLAEQGRRPPPFRGGGAPLPWNASGNRSQPTATVSVV